MKTKLGFKIWFNAVFFGLIGQIAWIVENMYFATFAQDVFSNSNRADLSYLVTTLMVILSAIVATVTTIFVGSLSDKLGNRKKIISFGYIVWGFTIMLFALIPMKVTGRMVFIGAVLLILFDCIMTFAGSSSNDAAFNAWVIDNTDETNRGLVDAVLSILPIMAVVIVFVVLGGLYNSNAKSNALFFIILGIIPILAGLIGIFILHDSKTIKKSPNNTLKDSFYGFNKKVIKENKNLYITLSAICLIGISQQTFFSYLINFLQITLGFGDGFVVPMAVIIVGSALFTGLMGFFYDKLGRRSFYMPLLLALVLGTIAFYVIGFIDNEVIKNLILYVGGILMMGGILSLNGALTANFQDDIPNGFEGRFQGVRMFFMVLIPMIIGPIVSLIIGLDAMGLNGSDFVPPYTIFLAASIIAFLAVIPLYFVRKNSNKNKSSKID